MKPFLRGPQGLMVVLIAVSALLLAIVVAEIVRGGKPRQEGPVPPAQLADVGLLPGFTLPPADQGFPEVANRPLFVPTRRPAPPALATQANMPKGQFALLGTSLTKELGDVALLKHLPSNKFHSVRKGEQVNGITVDTVGQDRVVLRQGDETEEVTLRTAKSSAVPPPPAPGMPGAPGMPPQLPATPNTTLPGSMPSRAPQPAPAMPSAAAPGQPATDSSQQLTPEQIIARRRAARAQQTQ